MKMYDSNTRSFAVAATPVRASADFDDNLIRVEIRNTGANPVYVSVSNNADTTNAIELLANSGALSVCEFKHGGQWVYSPSGSSVSIVQEFVLISAAPATDSAPGNTDPNAALGVAPEHVNIMEHQRK